ncbi:MAG TPA: ABC transporter permease [Vicinamibacteria bacterium]
MRVGAIPILGGPTDRRARAGLVGLAFLATTGVMASFLAPYSPRTQDRESFHRPPSLPGAGCSIRLLVEDETGGKRLFGFTGCRVYLLGTDALGRDVLSRILYGARVSVLSAFLGVIFAVSLGGLVGTAAALGGALWDWVLMRGTELVMSLPALYLILAVRSAFPDDVEPAWSALILIASLAFVGWCGVSRVVRAHVLSLRERDFVTAAVAAGASRWRIFFRHVLPNTLPLLWLQVGIMLPYFLIGEATLSFLGLGVQEPNPSWGNMLAAAAQSYTSMMKHWWTLAVPAGALTFSMLAANLWIEGTRESLLS